jgi:serine/threonine protein kinase/Flp pilus assembly protein TadD
MLVPGSTFSHFHIESILGQGGMGIAYKAVDARDNKVVALKLIADEFSRSEDYRARLTEEASRTAQVDSPYVVKVWEYDQVDGRPYLSMEYIPGGDLRNAAPKLDFKQKLVICKQIAEGVSAAHASGLVHRDLKPENIRLAEDGSARILDFGLAKTITADSVDEYGNIEGTLYYFSPEQLSGQPVGISSDLFSLGTVYYELFTGVRPFEGDYPTAIMYSILHEEPVPACELNADLPSWVDPLLNKLLAKNPRERFSSVSALLEYLTQSEKGQETSISRSYVKPRQTLTVIDLKNLSSDPSWDYFCMGFTEDIISELSRRSNLIVSAEPSTSQPRDVREIFKRCRSDFVLVGSLLKWQESIRLQIAIYGNGGEEQIFGETFQGGAAELFNLLSTAAREATIALSHVTGSVMCEVSPSASADVSAYDFYLKGKAYYQTNKAEDLEFATTMYQKALEIEPKFALAYAGLSDVSAFQYMAYYDHTQARITAAKEAAEKGMKIDPSLPEVHRSLGRYYMFTDNLEAAEKCFLTAIKYNRKYAVGYRTIGWLKLASGQHEEALQWARKSLELAPTDLETLLLLSLIYMDEKRFTVAISTLQRAIELGPDYGRAYYNLGAVYMKLGVFEAALENFLQAIRFKGDPNCYIDAGYVCLVTGDILGARQRFEESIAAGYMSFVSHYMLGYVAGLQGDAAEAIWQYRRVLELTRLPDGSPTTDIHQLGYQAMAYAGLGDRKLAAEILEVLEPRATNSGEVLGDIARAWAILGERQKAQLSLRQAFAAHAGPTEKEVALDPHFATLKD